MKSGKLLIYQPFAIRGYKEIFMREEERDAFLAKEKNLEKQQALRATEEARQEQIKHKSFAQLMFEGTFDPSYLLPFPVQDPLELEEGEYFIENLAKYLEANLDPNKVDKTREIPKKVIKEMGKRGVFALKIPKKYGGLGFSQANYNRLVSRVASYCGSTAVLISAHQSIGVPQPLKDYGTEEQKQKFLPLFREGKISAFALTEPDVGSDPARMSSTAILSEDCTHYILNGTKLWCTNGTIADYIVVMAKTAPKVIHGKERDQISAFVLDMRSPGIEIEHRCEFMGLSGIYNGQLKFTNVQIPVENLIDAEGRGLAMALGTINIGRLTLPAASAGVAKQALNIARRWGKERVQWGMPVGLHEAGRAKIAYIASTTFALEALSTLTSLWQDEEKYDIRIEAAMAKMFSTESLWSVVDQILQLRGGRGYEKATSLIARGEVGFPVERMMRDCRINTILEGSTEIMKLFLTREALDPHLKRLIKLLKKASIGEKIKSAISAFAYYLIWYPKQWIRSYLTPLYLSWGPFSKTMRFSDRMTHKISKKLFSSLLRYREGLEEKQMLVGRLMEMQTEIFAMSVVSAYAKHLKTKESEELAKHFCKEATLRVKKLYKELKINNDSSANTLAKKTLDGVFQSLEDGIIPIK